MCRSWRRCPGCVRGRTGPLAASKQAMYRATRDAARSKADLIEALFPPTAVGDTSVPARDPWSEQPEPFDVEQFLDEVFPTPAARAAWLIGLGEAFLAAVRAVQRVYEKTVAAIELRYKQRVQEAKDERDRELAEQQRQDELNRARELAQAERELALAEVHAEMARRISERDMAAVELESASRLLVELDREITLDTSTHPDRNAHRRALRHQRDFMQDRVQMLAAMSSDETPLHVRLARAQARELAALQALHRLDPKLDRFAEASDDFDAAREERKRLEVLDTYYANELVAQLTAKRDALVGVKI